MKTLVMAIMLSAASITLVDIRNLYRKAPFDKASCELLITRLESEKEPLPAGYYGAALMVMANHYGSPVEKLRTFNRGKEKLQQAIMSDILNPELKYLRFTIQTNSPVFLNYRFNIEADKKFLLDNYASITDNELKASIYNYLKSSTYLTDNEKKQLK